MKRFLIFSLIIFTIIFVFTACNETDQSNDNNSIDSSVNIPNIEINFPEFEQKVDEAIGTYYLLNVSNAKQVFSFYDYISVDEKLTWTLCKNVSGTETVPSKTVELLEGDNIYYVMVNNDRDVSLYTVNIHRNKMINIYFEGASPILVEEGKTILPPTIAFKQGYQFVKWDYDFSIPVSNSVTIKGIWEPSLNTLYFESNGAEGNSILPLQLKTGEKTTLPDNIFQKEGYSFGGWKTNNGTIYSAGSEYTMPSSNSTLYAHWIPNNNCVVLDGNGATSGTMDNLSAKTDSTITLPYNRFSRIGYTFIGWGTDPSGTVEYSQSAEFRINSSSITLYAIWQPVEYSINYSIRKQNTGSSTQENYIGSKDGNPMSYTIESKTITLIPPSIKGYTFEGWLTNYNWGAENMPQKDIKIEQGSTGNKTFIAVFSANSNKIYFYPNGGSGTMTEQIVEAGKTTSITANQFGNKPGYMFDGWSTVPNGDLVYENEDYINLLDDELHLYARWIEGTEGLIFTKTSSGYSAYRYDGVDTNVIIPSTHYGLPVTAISGWCFHMASHVESIELPENIVSIGELAFSSCSKIKTIVLPKTLTTIGNYAFRGCSNLESVIISNNVTTMGKDVFGSNSKITIYCEATQKPGSWDVAWNEGNCTVIWGYDISQ